MATLPRIRRSFKAYRVTVWRYDPALLFAVPESRDFRTLRDARAAFTSEAESMGLAATVPHRLALGASVHISKADKMNACEILAVYRNARR